MKDKIKELLGHNLPANVVASAVGVDASYVTQLMSEESFAREVADLRIASTIANASRDKEYDGIEDKLIEKLKGLLDSDLVFVKPRDILSAIQVINSAKRRAAPSELGSVMSQKNFVNLQLPANSEFVARFVVNKDNQVLEIAGKSVATMPAKGVVKQLEAMNKNLALNKPQQKADMEEAEQRLAGLVRLEELPVADLL